MALNEVAKHFYEKEVERLLGLDDAKIIKEKFIDMRSQIDDLYVELGERARRIAELEEENRRFKAQGERIAELETELSVKEDLLKIKNGLYNEKSVIEILKSTPFVEDVLAKEPLPFSDEQYEEDLIEELEDGHQQDCITINQLHTTIDTLVDRYAKLREMRGLYEK